MANNNNRNDYFPSSYGGRASYGDSQTKVFNYGDNEFNPWIYTISSGNIPLLVPSNQKSDVLITNNLTIGRNTLKIMGLTENLIISTENAGIGLVYS